MPQIIERGPRELRAVAGPGWMALVSRLGAEPQGWGHLRVNCGVTERAQLNPQQLYHHLIYLLMFCVGFSGENVLSLRTRLNTSELGGATGKH